MEQEELLANQQEYLEAKRERYYLITYDKNDLLYVQDSYPKKRWKPQE